jgi:hypothetical protein
MSADDGSQVIRILSPTAILGYGFPIESFREGMRHKPHVIAVDAGSTDPGPYYLGAGVPFTDRAAVRRDLRLLLEAARDEDIPLLIGSAGGSGGEPHLRRDFDLLLEVARELDVHFRLATIHAEVDRERVRDALGRGLIARDEPIPELTAKKIDASVRIVAQMGVEPMLSALESGADVVLAGRAYDPAVFAAVPLWRGGQRGPTVHLGKILECGAIAATPGSGSDCLIGYLDGGSFEVEPLNPKRRCTVTSVAAHTLYEKSDPLSLPGPGGSLDLSGTTFEQLTERRVRVSDSRFTPTGRYSVKLEGVEKVGYRTVSIAGCRDPFMIREIDAVIESVKRRVADNFDDANDGCALDFKLYGRNGVMGRLEPLLDHVPLELGIVIEAVAPTQQLADTVCGFARSTMLHCSYRGRIATAGNLAFPYSPSDFSGGEVFHFSIYHLMQVEDACELFPIDFTDV